MDHLICPNPKCSYEGEPQRKARGSLIIGMVLCCFFLVPGLLYFMIRSGYRYLCPKCGLQVASDN